MDGPISLCPSLDGERRSGKIRAPDGITVAFDTLEWVQKLFAFFPQHCEFGLTLETGEAVFLHGYHIVESTVLENRKPYKRCPNVGVC